MSALEKTATVILEFYFRFWKMDGRHVGFLLPVSLNFSHHMLFSVGLQNFVKIEPPMADL